MAEDAVIPSRSLDQMQWVLARIAVVFGLGNRVPPSVVNSSGYELVAAFRLYILHSEGILAHSL